MNPDHITFYMSTGEEEPADFFSEPCNDSGFAVFRSSGEVDAFVEKLKAHRDAAYGNWKGEPI